jgi:hypothetical protein
MLQLQNSFYLWHMAKRSTKKKAAKTAKRKPAKRAKRIAAPRKYAAPKRAPRKRTTTTTTKKTRKTRRIGSTNMSSKKTTVMGAALEGLMSGLGQYAGAVAPSIIPFDAMISGGIVFAGGVAARKFGAPAALASGFAGAGVLQLANAVMPLPGLTPAATVTGGVGRRRLSAAEVKMIEAAAKSDRAGMKGMKAETLHGRSIINRKTELF